MISDTDWNAFDPDFSDNHMAMNNRAWTNGCGVMFACTTSLMRVVKKYVEPGMPLTLESAKRLATGSMVYHVSLRNADGSAMRAKVTSVKTWKRSPDRVEVHVKHGLYDYAVFTEHDIHLLTVSEPQYPKNARKAHK